MAILWIAGLLIGLLIADRLLLAMEARGWIYWRKVKRPPSAGGDVFSGIDNVFNPGAAHRAEARETVHEDEEDGDDDDERDPDDRVS